MLGTDLSVLWSHFDPQGTAAKGTQPPPPADGSSGSAWQARTRWVQPHTKGLPASQLFVLLLKTDCFSFTLDFCTFLPSGMQLQQPHTAMINAAPSVLHFLLCASCIWKHSKGNLLLTGVSELKLLFFSRTSLLSSLFSDTYFRGHYNTLWL